VLAALRDASRVSIVEIVHMFDGLTREQVVGVLDFVA
jgi:hypothetical protein